MDSGNARATRASADLLNVKEKHGRLELHKKQLLQCQSDQTVECHTDQHKTVGASMEVQEERNRCLSPKSDKRTETRTRMTTRTSGTDVLHKLLSGARRTRLQ